MRKAIALAGTFAAAAAPATRADFLPLGEAALREMAGGKTVHLESPYGTLPVTFNPNGTFSAKASGLLAAYLGSASDRGRWTVQGDRICQKFFKWFSGETHCMRVKADGRKITWRRDDGLSGTATIAANEMAPPERPVGLGAPVDNVDALPPAKAVTASAAFPVPIPFAATVRPAPEAKRQAPAKVAAVHPAPTMSDAAAPVMSPLRDEKAGETWAAIDPGTLAFEVLGAQVRHGWCGHHGRGPAFGSRPALLSIARGISPDAAVGQASGCLAERPPLAEIGQPPSNMRF